jgi:hypothetical protein
MPSLASFQFLNVVELNPVPQSIFRLQTTANETAVYRTRLHLQNERERGWLLDRAEAGNYYAMEKLGEQLLERDNADERLRGLRWVLKAAELGSPSAQLLAAEHLLDGECVPERREEGGKWLEKAAESGYRPARVTLALRMLHGSGVEKQPARGMEMLSSAAIDGSVVAGATLAAYCFEKSNSRSDEAFAWLQRCGASQPEQMVKIAVFLYLQSREAATATMRARLVYYAGILLEQMRQQGVPGAAINLACLLRRQELSDGRFPRLADVLDPLIPSTTPFVVMNQALRIAAGLDVAPDWEAADALVASVDDVATILAWWRGSGPQSTDTEGHLVLAWLLRRHLRNDPDGLGLNYRANLAQAGGWKIPDWFTTHSVSPKHSVRRA